MATHLCMTGPRATGFNAILVFVLVVYSAVVQAQVIMKKSPAPRRSFSRVHLDHIYHRTVPARTSVVQHGSVSGVGGEGRGGAAIVLAIDRHFTWRGVVGLEVGAAQVPLGYNFSFVPPASYSQGGEAFESAGDKVNMGRSYLGLRAGYAHALGHRWHLQTMFSVRCSSMPKNAALWINYSTRLNDSTTAQFVTMRLDINPERRPYWSTAFGLGALFALNRRLDLGLSVSYEHFQRAAARGTYAVLPDEAGMTTTGTIRQSATNSGVALSFGVRFGPSKVPRTID